MKKKALNRKRKKDVNKNDSETLKLPPQATSENPAKGDSELVSYLTNLLGSLESRRVSDDEVASFIKEVRQRSFDSFNFHPYIGKKEDKQPP